MRTGWTRVAARDAVRTRGLALFAFVACLAPGALSLLAGTDALTALHVVAVPNTVAALAVPLAVLAALLLVALVAAAVRGCPGAAPVAALARIDIPDVPIRSADPDAAGRARPRAPSSTDR